MKMRSILAIIMGLLTIGMTSLFVISVNSNQSHLQKEYAQEQLQNITEEISEKLGIELKGNMKSMEVMSRLLSEKDSKDWSNRLFRNTLKDIADNMKFSQINICSIDGTGFDLEGKGQKVSFCPYYSRALLGDGSIAFSTFYETDENTKLIYTVPIYQEEEVNGILRASIEIDSLGELLFTDALLGKENIYLIRDDGIILNQVSTEKQSEKDILSLLEEKDTAGKKLEQNIEQGKMVFTEAQIQQGRSYLCYYGIKNLNNGGILLTIPTKQLIALYNRPEWILSSAFHIIILALALASAVGLSVLAFSEAIKRYRIERLAYYDEVIDGINLNRFRLDSIARLKRATGTSYSIVVAAVDRLDYIKEFFGAPEGYKILNNISQTIKKNLKQEELFCRISADNFALFLNYHNKEELTDRITFLDATINNEEATSRNKDKYELHLHYGIYCIDSPDIDIDAMISRASHALHQVKYDKKQPYEFYSGAMQNRIVDEKEIEDHMFTALEEKEYLVYLQPKYELKTGQQVGAEALVRWMHPEKGLMYPGRFIGVFEKNGFIVRLDMYILDVLCQKLKAWMVKGYRPLPLSINISRLNLFDENFIENVIAILERYGIPSNLIQLEIAEEVVSDNVDLLSSLLDRLKAYGFLISMDDFGTGTTSMNTLYQVHVDELKLDRTFILSAEKTDRGKNVIRSVIDLAKRLDIKVVSEGVENKAQARMLQELGCDMIQGYVFSDPLPIREYEKYAYGPGAKDNKVW